MSEGWGLSLGSVLAQANAFKDKIEKQMDEALKENSGIEGEDDLPFSVDVISNTVTSLTDMIGTRGEHDGGDDDIDDALDVVDSFVGDDLDDALDVVDSFVDDVEGGASLDRDTQVASGHDEEADVVEGGHDEEADVVSSRDDDAAVIPGHDDGKEFADQEDGRTEAVEPEAYSLEPEADAAEQVADLPEQVADLPEQVPDAPEQVPDAPEQVPDLPEQVVEATTTQSPEDMDNTFTDPHDTNVPDVFQENAQEPDFADGNEVGEDLHTNDLDEALDILDDFVDQPDPTNESANHQVDVAFDIQGANDAQTVDPDSPHAAPIDEEDPLDVLDNFIDEDQSPPADLSLQSDNQQDHDVVQQDGIDKSNSSELAGNDNANTTRAPSGLSEEPHAPPFPHDDQVVEDSTAASLPEADSDEPTEQEVERDATPEQVPLDHVDAEAHSTTASGSPPLASDPVQQGNAKPAEHVEQESVVEEAAVAGNDELVEVETEGGALQSDDAPADESPERAPQTPQHDEESPMQQVDTQETVAAGEDTVQHEPADTTESTKEAIVPPKVTTKSNQSTARSRKKNRRKKNRRNKNSPKGQANAATQNAQQSQTAAQEKDVVENSQLQADNEMGEKGDGAIAECASNVAESNHNHETIACVEQADTFVANVAANENPACDDLSGFPDKSHETPLESPVQRSEDDANAMGEEQGDDPVQSAEQGDTKEAEYARREGPQTDGVVADANVSCGEQSSEPVATEEQPSDRVPSDHSSPAITEDSSPAIAEDSSPAIAEDSSPAITEDSSPAIAEDSSPAITEDLPSNTTPDDEPLSDPTTTQEQSSDRASTEHADEQTADRGATEEQPSESHSTTTSSEHPGVSVDIHAALVSEFEAKIQQLQLQVQRQEDANGELKQVVAQREQQLEVAVVQSSQAQEQLMETEAAVDAGRTQVSNLKENLQKRENEVRKLKQLLTDSQDKSSSGDTAVKQLRRNLEEMEARAKEAETRAEGLLAEGMVLSKKQGDAEQAVRKIRKEKKEQDAQVQKLKSQLQGSTEEIASLKASLASVTQAKQQNDRTIAELSDAKAKLAKEMSAMESAKKIALDRQKELQSALDDSWGELTEKNKQEALLRQELNDSNAEVATMSHQLQEQINSTHLRGDRVSNMEKALFELRQTLTQQSQEASQMESTLRGEIKMHIHRVQEVERRNEELIETSSKEKQQILKHIADLTTIGKSREEYLEAEHSSLLTRAVAAEKGEANAIAAKKVLEVAKSELVVRVAELEASTASLEGERNRHGSEVQRLQEEIAQLRHERGSISSELDEVRKEHDMRQKETRAKEARLRQALVAEQERFEQMQSEFSSKHEKLEQRYEQSLKQFEELKKKRLLSRGSSSMAHPSESPDSVQGTSTSDEYRGTQDMLHATTSQERILEHTLGGGGDELASETGGGSRSEAGASYTAAPPTVAMQRLQNTIKQREGELAGLKDQLAGVERSRDALSEELVRLTEQAREMKSSAALVEQLKKQVAELESTKEVLLQLVGEKDEQVEDLMEDLKDVKALYRDEYNTLLTKIEEYEKVESTADTLKEPKAQAATTAEEPQDAE